MAPPQPAKETRRQCVLRKALQSGRPLSKNARKVLKGYNNKHLAIERTRPDKATRAIAKQMRDLTVMDPTTDGEGRGGGEQISMPSDMNEQDGATASDELESDLLLGGSNGVGETDNTTLSSSEQDGSLESELKHVAVGEDGNGGGEGTGNEQASGLREP